MALGLKCGGTLEERAQRLFTTKGKSLSEIDPTLFAKGQGKGKEQEKSKEAERHRRIALMEAQIYKYEFVNRFIVIWVRISINSVR